MILQAKDLAGTMERHKGQNTQSSKRPDKAFKLAGGVVFGRAISAGPPDRHKRQSELLRTDYRMSRGTI